MKTIFLSLLTILSTAVQANASIYADPIMGAGFVRNMECIVKITTGGRPADANLLILGTRDGNEPMAVLVANGQLRFAAKTNQVPRQGQTAFRSQIIGHDFDTNSDYILGQIGIDLTNGRGALRSYSEPYILGSFNIFNCKFR